MTTEPTTHPLPDGVTVQIDVTPDGHYVPAVAVGHDEVHALTPTKMRAYAGQVFAAVAAAEHDVAVMRQQFALLDADVETAAAMLMALRSRRPTASYQLPGTPLALEPRVAQMPDGSFRGFLVVHHRGRLIGEWSTGDAREHGMYAAMIGPASALDRIYHEVLTTVVDLEDDVARRVISALPQHRDPS